MSDARDAAVMMGQCERSDIRGKKTTSKKRGNKLRTVLRTVRDGSVAVAGGWDLTVSIVCLCLGAEALDELFEYLFVLFRDASAVGGAQKVLHGFLVERGVSRDQAIGFLCEVELLTRRAPWFRDRLDAFSARGGRCRRHRSSVLLLALVDDPAVVVEGNTIDDLVFVGVRWFVVARDERPLDAASCVC
jgi:hypothetical protein